MLRPSTGAGLSTKSILLAMVSVIAMISQMLINVGNIIIISQRNFQFFQYDCTNTLNDQILENVTVQMDTADGFEVIKYLPCPSLPYDKPGTTYTICALPDDPTAG